MAIPNLIFGTANVGEAYTSVEAVQALLDALQSLDIKHIDTAARYPPTNSGASETLLGEAKASQQGFELDTKIKFEGSPDGSITPEKVEASVQQSLSRIGKIVTLYIHAPDNQTPLELQAKALNEEYKRGHFQELGVSNFSPELLAEFISTCEKNNYVKPTVYQGRYNLITRRAEEDLLPTLRAYGLKFNAYAPIAGGFLTGSFTNGAVEGTRFSSDNPMGTLLKRLYDKPEIHAAMVTFHKTIESMGISGPEAGLRWIVYHSALRRDDGVILGASKIEQLKSNAKAIQNGPLPTSVLEAAEQVWQSIENVAPSGLI